MNEIYLIEVTQPIGTFYIGKIKSKDLLQIAKSETRTNSGIQRVLNSNRTQSIAKYCSDPDAIFPTPIILSISSNSEKFENYQEKHSGYELDKMENTGIFIFKYDDSINASILDGQHRLYGIEKSNKEFELPIALTFDLTEEEKAYIFSTINSNQKQVDKSLIYDLFELSTYRSPYKTGHYLARIFNSNKDSALYNRLKMLEKKTSQTQSLSQGTFVNYIIKYLISSNPKQDMIDIKNNKMINDNKNYPLRKYFINNQDEVIYKILKNYFDAVKLVFPKEWENYNKFILSKSTGFGALIRSLKVIIGIGENKNTLDIKFFITGLESFKEYLKDKKMELTSNFFSSNHQEQKKLSDIIIKGFKDI